MPHAAHREEPAFAPAPLADALPVIETVATPDDLVTLILDRTPERGGYRTLVAPQSQGIDAGPTAILLAQGLVAATQPSLLVEWAPGTSQLAASFGLASSPGLAELIAGDATFEDVITTIPGTQCHFLSAGDGLETVAAARDPDQVNLVLDALDEAYAHIIVTGEHDFVRTLFETIEGRFDAGIVVTDPDQPHATLRDPDGTFLGFEVADIHLLKIAQSSAAMAAAGLRIKEQAPGRRAKQPA